MTCKRLIFLFLVFFTAIVSVYADRVLYKEDFGGNDSTDAAYRAAPLPYVSGLTYGGNDCRGSGRYAVHKRGTANGTQWHDQDDHTYPDNYERGYFMQVDGNQSKTAVFFRDTLRGLCPSATVRFSAWVCNVLTMGTNEGTRPGFYHNYMQANLSFIFKNPNNDDLLAKFDTGDVPWDSISYFNYYQNVGPQEWTVPAQWIPYGYNLTLPAGVTDVVFEIQNNILVSKSYGNDFALDDIEISLVTPDISVTAPDVLYEHSDVVFVGQVENNISFSEPLDLGWEYSKDSITWETLGSDSASLVLENVIMADSGYYRFVVASGGGMDNNMCRAYSEPLFLHVKRSESVHDTAYYSVCDSMEYRGTMYYSSFTHNDTIPREHASDSIHTDSVTIHHFVQTRDTIPVTDSITFQGVFYTRDTVIQQRFDGVTLFGCDSVAIHDLLFSYTPVYDTTFYSACSVIELNGQEYRYSLMLREVIEREHQGDSIHCDSITIHYYSYDIDTMDVKDSITLQEVLYTKDTTILLVHEGANMYGCDSLVIMTLNFSYSPLHDTAYTQSFDSAWYNGLWYYRDTMLIDTIPISTKQDSIHVQILHIDYTPIIDTTYYSACDSLEYRGVVYYSSFTHCDTIKGYYAGDTITIDSILISASAHSYYWQACLDSALYDGVMYYADTMFVQTISGGANSGCDSVHHHYLEFTYSPPVDTTQHDTIIPQTPDTLPHYDTIPLIINKYNWIIITNNTLFQSYYPNAQIQSFCWYKNDTCVSSDYFDFYTEDRLLDGTFQLVIYLDSATKIYSNTLVITPSTQPAPPRLSVNPVQHGQQTYLIYDGHVRYEIFTATGVRTHKGEGENKIPLPPMDKGIYIIRVYYGEDEKTLKLMAR